MTGYWRKAVAAVAPDLPRPVPSYGTKPGFTPETSCPDIHHKPIPKGSRIYCEACGQWGCDYLLVGMPTVPIGYAMTPEPQYAPTIEPPEPRFLIFTLIPD